jgi:hypothetical protein
MNISEITLFNTLKIKLGEQEAQSLVEGITTEVAEEFKNKKDMLAAKSDIHHLENEIEKVKARLLVMEWMLGFLLAGMLSLIVKSFFWFLRNASRRGRFVRYDSDNSPARGETYNLPTT